MTYTPKLEDYMKALGENRVFACEDEHYIGFKYNAPTVIFHYWDDVTLNARGIVFDKATGEIVARPFYKFFNYEELINGAGARTDILDKMEACGFKFDRTESFRVMDKLDGSLGIMFYDKYAGSWRVKTGGAFGSDQAVWANEWAKKNITSGLDTSLTYCYEIIYDADVHPISYDFEGMVLLGAIDTATGEEVSLEQLRQIAVEQKVRLADIIEFKSFDEAISYAKNLSKTKEGVVVTFKNGFKVKIKGHEFLALQKQFHAITKEMIWENYDCENWLHPYTAEFLASIPEEMKEMHDYAEELDKKISEATYVARSTAYRVYKMIKDANLQRRDAFTLITSCFEKYNPRLVGPAMKVYSLLEQGKTDRYISSPECVSSIVKLVHRLFKP